MNVHNLKIPKGQPPLAPLVPMRICLNLDQIPLQQTVYQQTQRHKPMPDPSINNDYLLMQTYMNCRFHKETLIDSVHSNFASAFTSQSQFYQDETPVAIPNLTAHIKIPKSTRRQPIPETRPMKKRTKDVKATRLMCFK